MFSTFSNAQDVFVRVHMETLRLFKSRTWGKWN